MICGIVTNIKSGLLLYFYLYHISFLDYIIAAYGTDEAFFAGFGVIACFKERLPVYDLGSDEEFFKVGMNGPSRSWYRIADVSRPGARLVLAGGQEGK